MSINPAKFGTINIFEDHPFILLICGQPFEAAFRCFSFQDETVQNMVVYKVTIVQERK